MGAAVAHARRQQADDPGPRASRGARSAACGADDHARPRSRAAARVGDREVVSAARRNWHFAVAPPRGEWWTLRPTGRMFVLRNPQSADTLRTSPVQLSPI